MNPHAERPDEHCHVLQKLIPSDAVQVTAVADAIATAERRVADLKAQIDANRDLSTSLAFDDGSAWNGE